MNPQKSSLGIVMKVATILLITSAGCLPYDQRVTAARTCIFVANETRFVGQQCDPNGSLTLVWDETSHNATSGLWNEETTGNPCPVFPAYVQSGTVIPGGSLNSTNLKFTQPTVPDTFFFEGSLSADGKTLEGVMDTIRFEAKGETTCTCGRPYTMR